MLFIVLFHNSLLMFSSDLLSAAGSWKSSDFTHGSYQLYAQNSNPISESIVPVLPEVWQLRAVPTALGRLFHAHPLVQNLSLTPSCPSPGTAPCCSLRFCHCQSLCISLKTIFCYGLTYTKTGKRKAGGRVSCSPLACGRSRFSSKPLVPQAVMGTECSRDSSSSFSSWLTRDSDRL